MAKNNDDDLLDDDTHFKDEYELNLEEEDALLAFNEDEVPTSDGCVDRSGEVEYVDEEGNPVSVQEGRSLEVVGIHEDYSYGAQDTGNEEDDVLEVDVDQEFDALVQETDDFDSPRGLQARGRSRERTPQRTPHPPTPVSSASSRHHSAPGSMSQRDVAERAASQEGGGAEGEEVEENEDGRGGEDEDDDDEEDGEKGRGRFRAERRETSTATGTAKRRENIPDSLDSVISAEDAAKVDAYLSREEERKRGGRRGGRARGGGSFRRGGHRGPQSNKPPQQHIDPWMPHSGPMALQQGHFPGLGTGVPQRNFPGVSCMNDGNLRGKIFVNPQFQNGGVPPGGQGIRNPGLMMGRPPHFQQLGMPPQQRGMFTPVRQDPFPFAGPPIMPRQDQRPPLFLQNPGNDRGYQRPSHLPSTTFASNGPHSVASPQFSSSTERFVPTTRPGLEPFEMPPPAINFGPGRNGEFQHRHDIDPWALRPSGHSGMQTGARHQPHPFGSPPHYTNAPLQPPQQQHLASPVAAHPFPAVSQHQPPPPVTVPARQLPHDPRYQPRPPPPHFQQQQQQRAPPPPQMMDTSRPPPPPHSQHRPGGSMPPLSVSSVHPSTSPPGEYGRPPASGIPSFQQSHGVPLGKRSGTCDRGPQGPLLSCPTPKVGRMDSPRSSRGSAGRTVNSSNIKEVPIVENLPPPEPVKASLPKEVEEDAETQELRRKIEEQKKLREQVLRIKAERRKLAAMQRQADLMEQKLHSGDGDGHAGADVGDAKSTAVPAETAAGTAHSLASRNVQPPVQAVALQEAQKPAKPALSVKQRLGLKPNQQLVPAAKGSGAGSGPGGGTLKKVVIVRRNPPQNPQVPQRQGSAVAAGSRRIISLTPQGQGPATRGLASRGRAGATAAIRGGRPGQRAVLPPPLQQQQGTGPAKKVIKIVPTAGTRGRGQASSLQGRGGGVGQRGAHHQAVPGQVPPTTQVLVSNLSMSTTEAQLRHLGSTCGVITAIVLDRNQRRAMIAFREQQQAITFQKKYQRHMLDLSMIQVSLLPP